MVKVSGIYRSSFIGIMDKVSWDHIQGKFDPLSGKVGLMVKACLDHSQGQLSS
jgi:hypothetical protein